MRHPLSSSLIIGTLLLLPLATLAAGFSDVPASHPNYEAVTALNESGKVEGYLDGTFKPETLINRAEFGKIIAELLVSEAELSSCPREQVLRDFVDVGTGVWYDKHLCVLVQKKLVQGYADKTFRGGVTITLVEAAKMLHGFVRDKEGKEPFIPVDAYGVLWWSDYVTDLSSRMAIPTSVQRLDQKITRGEMAEMLFRIDANVRSKAAQDKGILIRNTERHGGTLTVDYFLRYLYQTAPEGADVIDGMDARLVQRDRATGRETVIFTSIKNALPELKSTRDTLFLHAQPSDNLVIFSQNLPDAGHQELLLWAFDRSAKAFRKMKVNHTVARSVNTIYPGRLSPNESLLVLSSQDGKTLHLIDLVRDTAKDLVALQDRETLDAALDSEMHSTDISWVDQNTIRYAVYDESKKPQLDPMLDYKDRLQQLLIGYRTVKVSADSAQSRSAAQDWKTFRVREFAFDYPANWHFERAGMSGEERYSAVLNGREIASLSCPIREAGYEAWDFEEHERTFRAAGRTYGATLWIGTALESFLEDAVMIFMHRNDFDHWYEEDDYHISCELFAAVEPDEALRVTFRKIYESVRAR